MMSLITRVLILLTISLMQYNCVMTLLLKSSEPPSNYLFASELLPFIFENKSTENIVYSPASIFTSLALTYLSAQGQTADELRRALKLKSEDKINFAFKYGDFSRTPFTKTKPESNAPEFVMYNRLYVNSKFKVVKPLSKIANENFDFEGENVEQISMDAGKINYNKLGNIIRSNAVNNTGAVVVNAIYFKARWLHPFLPQHTRKGIFHISDSKKVKVDIMLANAQFGYYKSSKLNAQVLEMPYDNSDISMLIILPDETRDLDKLEKKLKEIDLNDITSKLVVQTVAVVIPKFHIKFDINLKETLEGMGCSSMFRENVNLTGIFKNAKSQKILDIKHKTFLDFSEGGSNAVASSEANPEPVYLDPKQKFVIATRPFFFIVRNKSTIFFTGHVAKF